MPKKVSYRQPEKERIRQSVLPAAVRLLTRSRSRSTVIQPSHVKEVLEHGLGLLRQRNVTRDSAVEFNNWSTLHKRVIGKKRADEIKVLYLCGPEPLNDLSVLLENGVDPHNVWAVESDPKEFTRAVTELQNSKLPVKIYHGDIAGFLEANSDTFDIIYVDNCSPFGAGKPNSLHAILQLFKHQRLEPLGVLITTFAALSIEHMSWYTQMLSSYFRYRYDDVPRAFWDSGLDPAVCEHDDSGLRNAILEQPVPYYSEFITRLITDIARSIIPNCRAFAFQGVERTLLASKRDRNQVIKIAEHSPLYKKGVPLEKLFGEIGDFALNPAGYPVFSFMRALEADPNSNLVQLQFKNTKIGSHHLIDGTKYAALLENCIEGHWGALGDSMIKAIGIGWFDEKIRLSCDVPLPNLMVNSLLGIYGAPSFSNPRYCQRYSYTSKRNLMYTDLFLLDRCRSYFDWFPTAHTAKARFQSEGFQMVARCIMDGIGWADWHSKSHPFRGAAMGGINATKHSKPRTFDKRVEIC